MKAVVHDRYGSPNVLRIADAPAPTPKDDEVLIRIRATTVTRTDVHMRMARPIVWRFYLGLRRPKQPILGVEFSGEVAAIGPAVKQFAVGDRVFGARNATHAQYVCMPETRLVAHMPEGATFEEAAAVADGFHQGLVPLRIAGVGKNTRLVVYGASGSCGPPRSSSRSSTSAASTSPPCANTKNIELVRSLGADEVVTTCRRTSRIAARRTTSCSMQSASTRSIAHAERSGLAASTSRPTGSTTSRSRSSRSGSGSARSCSRSSDPRGKTSCSSGS